MKTKPITYLAAALALAVAGSSCDHDEIYEPLDFAVRLAPTNTYRVGEPVVFNFEGNADYITFWSGDVGHEYRYRDRTTVAIENIESCELSFGLAQAYGQNDTDTRYCDILVTDQFAGLSGSDATADGALVAAIDDQHTGWTEIPYENLSNRTSLVNVPKVNYTYDITPYAGNFCLALHFHHGENQNMRSFAFNNLRITVQFDGYDPAEYTFDDLSFVSYSTIEQHADNPYVHNVSGDGYVKLAGKNGSNSAGEIVYRPGPRTEPVIVQNNPIAAAMVDVDDASIDLDEDEPHDAAEDGHEDDGDSRRIDEFDDHTLDDGDVPEEDR